MLTKDIKKDFPILNINPYKDKKLIYLDNGATSQKPQCVIDAITNYYETSNANIHRGVHYLSEKATLMYEETRDKVQNFIGAGNREEIIFTRNATSALNLLAYSFVNTFLQKGDIVLITDSEHHSNIVPWQLMLKDKGCILKSVPITKEGRLEMSEFQKLLTKKVKLVSVGHMANSTGVVHDIKTIIDSAHSVGAKVCIDASQSVPHMEVNVKKLDCDFLVFTGHKMLAPMGVGVLYGKKEILNQMKPYQGGGDMIDQVSLEETTYNSLPYKFEAGTPNVSAVIGLCEAIDYLNKIGLENIHKHELELTELLLNELKKDKTIKIIGPTDMDNRGGIVSFTLDKIHPHDIATILDQEGIAVRAGHHCAQLVMKNFSVPATVRASFYLYNTKEDVYKLLEGIEKVKRILK